jgi:hypothetical protein
MPRRWIVLPVAVIAAVLLLGAEPVARVAPDGPLSATPLFQRVDLGTAERVSRTITIHATTDLTLLAVESPCRCVALATALPLQVKARSTATLDLTVSGALPGLKTLILRTTAGTVSIQVQVVSAGFGEGLASWRALEQRAVDQRCSLVVIAHDLRGETRNCGCSGGSLGGIDHLAALPAALAGWAPGIPLRCVLTGDVEGHRPGVEAALIAAGWIRDPSIAVTGNPALDVQDPRFLAVIPTIPTSLNHRKLITPVLTGGMTAEVVLVDAAGQIVEHDTLPIDRTLPADPTILGRFPDPLTATVDSLHVSSQACMACHATAHQTWSTSRHALAWTSLKPEDRTDACITCHSTQVVAQPPTVVPGVQCQSCHLGADAHAAAPTIRTTGRTDCRSCHDARHDPGFDSVKAWAAVVHGR